MLYHIPKLKYLVKNGIKGFSPTKTLLSCSGSYGSVGTFCVVVVVVVGVDLGLYGKNGAVGPVLFVGASGLLSTSTTYCMNSASLSLTATTGPKACRVTFQEAALPCPL